MAKDPIKNGRDQINDIIKEIFKRTNSTELDFPDCYVKIREECERAITDEDYLSQDNNSAKNNRDIRKLSNEEERQNWWNRLQAMKLACKNYRYVDFIISLSALLVSMGAIVISLITVFYSTWTNENEIEISNVVERMSSFVDVVSIIVAVIILVSLILLVAKLIINGREKEKEYMYISEILDQIEKEFPKYSIEDESDIDDIRIELNAAFNKAKLEGYNKGRKEVCDIIREVIDKQ